MFRKAYLQAVNRSMGIPIDNFMIIISNDQLNIEELGVHKKAAIDLARWVNKDFAVHGLKNYLSLALYHLVKKRRLNN